MRTAITAAVVTLAAMLSPAAAATTPAVQLPAPAVVHRPCGPLHPHLRPTCMRPYLVHIPPRWAS
jgi:hypothetical protein